MEEILLEIMAIATAIGVIVSALVEAFKKATEGKFPTKFLPIVALGLGILIGGLASISFPPLDVPFAYMLWAGGIAGLSSVGLFEGVRNIVKK